MFEYLFFVKHRSCVALLLLLFLLLFLFHGVRWHFGVVEKAKRKLLTVPGTVFFYVDFLS